MPGEVGPQGERGEVSQKRFSLLTLFTDSYSVHSSICTYFNCYLCNHITEKMDDRKVIIILENCIKWFGIIIKCSIKNMNDAWTLMWFMR